MGSSIVRTEPAAQPSPDSATSSHSPSDTNALDRVESNVSQITEVKSDVTHGPNPDGTLPKTDKPRPHVCTTCSRSFARLEHLKRHERSHTKEKPFACPECTRCFARRDLLLRHQQKLHMTTAPSARPKNARRDSATALGPNGSGKVRKNSVVANSATNNANNMRPRANTISHVDGSTLGMLAAANRSMPNAGGFAHPNLPRGYDAFDQNAMAEMPGGHANMQSLPRLATRDLNVDPNANLRTAPAGHSFHGMDFDQMYGFNSTVNPAQLHMGESMSATSPFANHVNPFSTGAIMEDDDGQDWMRGFHTQLAFNGPNENAVGGSSPSAMSTESPEGFNEHHFNVVEHQLQNGGVMWQQNMMQQGQPSFHFENGAGNGFGDFNMAPDALSPANLRNHMNQSEQMFNGQQMPGNLSPQAFMNGNHGPLHAPMQFGSDVTSISTASLNSSGRLSSVTSASTDSITDVTRQALLLSLSQPSVFGGHGARKYSQPSVSSPLSPRENLKGANSPPLPNTLDLQRYVGAYIQFFHPHFPFLHIPTLSFDSPAYTSNLRAANSSTGFGNGGIMGGGGCLILAMAAIGALYEGDRAQSKELFEGGKKMIQLYLEERRKADMSTTSNSPRSANDLAAQNTPLWLVQAMLLNVIYGHNCGDKIAGDIASTHCIALVSLARAAELVRPLSEVNRGFQRQHASAPNGDMHMTDDSDNQEQWGMGSQTLDENSHWHQWIAAEERKRTLFAIFHMSSLLVSAYNHAPALMNSEIQLDLPCDEDVWTAETAGAWMAKGGAVVAEQKAIPFATALSTLLTASQHSNEQVMYSHQFGPGMPMGHGPSSELHPSTFGCLVLINALHNYIWETRQRHSGRRWTTQETEAMHAHIEPALRAWQSAWASNPTHSLERPNPYGMGPLSADSIPLLDLAYVRLFVNLGASKEAFWQRDWDAMSEELARGSEIIQHAEHNDSTGQNSENQSRQSPGLAIDATLQHDPKTRQPSSKRERHLRKAALYAADSLSMSDKLGVTFADFTSRELPVQSALCSFDCTQVLAEWVSTVQERVGKYLGILGRDPLDVTQVPAIMLLEDEDVRLLDKIAEIVKKAESKMAYDMSGMSNSVVTSKFGAKGSEGYGSKVLLITAYMLERAAVWPVTSIMSAALTTQADHMTKRAEVSLMHL